MSLALIAVCAACGVAASTATAASEYTWRVEKATLKEGQSRKMTVAAETFVLETEVLGAPVTMECKLNVLSMAIQGGIPGKATAKLEFTKCKVLPSNCEASISVLETGGEIVTVVEPVAIVGHNSILLEIKNKPIIKLKGLACKLAGETELIGTIAPPVMPDKMEAVKHKVEFNEPPVSEIKKFGGENREVGLKLTSAKVSVEVIGQAEAAIVEEKESWGTF